MKINPNNPTQLIDAALGRIPVDLLIKNINVVNLFTGEIIQSQVGIYDGFIAFVDNDHDGLNREDITYQAKQEIDGTDKFLIPGFIDAHLHIESTMMTPQNFTEAVLPWGTTTVVTDPHEIGNVLGIEGVKYMAESSDNLPVRHLVLAPSCVPSVENMEDAGAKFHAEQIQELLDNDSIFGLGEVMDYDGVLNKHQRMNSILALANKRSAYIQGHAPAMFGRKLNAYLCSGPKNDHECRSGQEAKDKMRLGMYVDARESSISQNVTDIVQAIKDFKFHDHLCLCTDDREAADILESGHMNHVVKTAIEAGLDPITAIRCATLHTAKELGYTNLGAVAPGYVADLQIISDLQKPVADTVIAQGNIVAQNQKLLTPISKTSHSVEEKDTTSLIPEFSIDMLTIKSAIKEGEITANVLHYHKPNSSLTSWQQIKFQVKDHQLILPKGYLFALVQNRYGKKDNRTLAIISGFGLEKGAIASTVSHDCHNLTLVFSDPQLALKVITELKNNKGGIACCDLSGKVESLALPVAGLMSKLNCQQLANKAEIMKNMLRDMGLTQVPNPLLRISTLALPVIPNAKLSDHGLIDVKQREIIPLFVD